MTEATYERATAIRSELDKLETLCECLSNQTFYITFDTKDHWGLPFSSTDRTGELIAQALKTVVDDRIKELKQEFSAM